MLHDPLLPPPPPTSRMASPKKKRRPSVAISAKILATGLATTATLGLTTGYALASKAKTQNQPEQTGIQPTPTISAPTAVPSTAPPATSPAVNSQDNPAPVVTSPPVVVVPVPTIAPAQPGNNWGNSGSNQTSNGSN
jgi:hypothetical protein